MAKLGDTARTSLKSILEAVLLAADEPLDRAALASVFAEDEQPGDSDIARALAELDADYAERGLEVWEKEASEEAWEEAEAAWAAMKEGEMRPI